MDILAWRFTERAEPGEGLSENSVQTDLRGFLLKAGQGDGPYLGGGGSWA